MKLGADMEFDPQGRLSGVEGTLAFRFRLSGTDYFSPKEPFRIVLAESPSLRLEYAAAKMYLSFAGDPDEPGPRRFQFTHFKADQWYHLAIVWDARAGTVQLYLNGRYQENSGRAAWRPAGQAGPMSLGGAAGDLEIAVSEVEAYDEALEADEVAALSGIGACPPLAREGKTVPAGSLDLQGRELECIWQPQFGRPLNVIREDELFEGDRRSREPEGFDWVLEGAGQVYTKGGRLYIVRPDESTDVDLWSTHPLPADFLLEFDFFPGDPECGLVIIWFCATGPEGQSVFALDMPKRQTVWQRYHSGALRCYHTSFWATEPWNRLCRGTSNLRKNPGHRLVAIGNDNIAGRGPGPHRVRLCRIGTKIQLETNGKLAVVWDDDGEYGPAWPGGYFALHQMFHTGSASYADMKAYRIKPA